MINEKTTRENILKSIRNASLVRVENPYSSVNQEAEIYTQGEDDLLIRFATELTQIGGSFVYCSNVSELYDELNVLMQARNLNSFFTIDKKISNLMSGGGIPIENSVDKMSEAAMILTGCETMVARLGSVVVSSKQMSGRLANFIPDVHIVLASQSQVVESVKDAIDFLRKKYNQLPSLISFVTGPSRTADIEKTLVMGAHGPRELIVFVLDKLPE